MKLLFSARAVIIRASGGKRRVCCCRSAESCWTRERAAFRLGRHLQTPEADIFLTHAHLDHSAGLTYLFSVLKEHPLTRLTIHAEAEKLKGIVEHLFSRPLFPVKPPWEFRTLEKRRGADFPEAGNLPQGGRLSYFPLGHPGGAVGFRLDWPGHGMAYVTDTTADPRATYVKNIQGADLLVHECYYSDANADLAAKYGHSSLSAVAETARAANVGKLILTHLDPRFPTGDNLDLDAARRIFPRIELAEDLQEVEF